MARLYSRDTQLVKARYPRSMRYAAIALALGACNGTVSTGAGDAPRGTGDARADAPGGIGEPANLAGMTLYHNQVRAAVDTTGIAAGPLPYLPWAANLANYP